MSKLLLFCTASSDAHHLVRKVMNLDNSPYEGEDFFWLVDRRDGPDDERCYRCTLEAEGVIEPGFRNASPQECQEWASERWNAVNQYLFVEQNVLIIIDDRSLVDDTVLIQQFFKGEDEPWMYNDDGCKLPPKEDTWFEWRVKYEYTIKAWACLRHGPFVNVHPVFYALKEKLTDAQGVFDFEKAYHLVGSTDPIAERRP